MLETLLDLQVALGDILQDAQAQATAESSLWVLDELVHQVISDETDAQRQRIERRE
jgi:hypothetical protein